MSGSKYNEAFRLLRIGYLPTFRDEAETNALLFAAVNNLLHVDNVAWRRWADSLESAPDLRQRVVNQEIV